MSDEKKTEEVIEETQQAAPEADTPKDEPKEEKKEKGKKEKAEKKKEAAAPKEEQPAEPAQGASDAYLRLLAEYDNYRKRSQREKDALYADIKADTLKKFLPVYDNLVRALNQSTADEAYRKGVEMIMTQFTSASRRSTLSAKPSTRPYTTRSCMWTTRRRARTRSSKYFRRASGSATR